MTKIYNHPDFYNLKHHFKGESWKPIQKYEKHYSISSMGRVKSFDRIVNGTGPRLQKGRMMKQSISTQYLHIGLTINEAQRIFKVHRLVTVHFVMKDNIKPCINHINCDKLDNRSTNLEWCTQRENSLHAVKNGLMPFGENSGASILTASQVLLIRELSGEGATQRALADQFNISASMIHCIVSGKSWKQLL